MMTLWKPIVAIDELGEEDTWEIETENAPNTYSVDRAVVHNSYSFNKSHCVAYSLLAVKMMTFKVLHPYEFYTALLQHEKDEDRVAAIYEDMHQKDMRILPPDINKSGVDYTLRRGKRRRSIGIKCGMLKVKFVGEALCRGILKQRPFDDIENFVCNVAGANKRAVENLILAGFFDLLHPNRRMLLENYGLIRTVKNHNKMYDDGIRILTNTKGMRIRVKAWCHEGRRRTDHKQIWRTMKRIGRNWARDDWGDDEKERKVADVYPVLFTKYPIDYYEDAIASIVFKKFMTLKRAERIRKKLSEEAGKGYKSRVLCSVVACGGTPYMSRWGDWLASKPTEGDMEKYPGLNKYPWGSPWAKVTVKDWTGTSLYALVKPDVYARYATLVDRIKRNTVLIVLYVISNYSKRLNIKDILFLDDLRDGNAKGVFVDSLMSGKVQVGNVQRN